MKNQQTRAIDPLLKYVFGRWMNMKDQQTLLNTLFAATVSSNVNIERQRNWVTYDGLVIIGASLLH